MSNTWSAKSYSQFLDIRTRPARDLLNAIPNSFHPKLVYDLGCGPGNSTILLAEKWPQAKIIGLDNSFEMLNEAKRLYPHIEFIHADIATWLPTEKIDCLFANASLQWLNDHNVLIPKLLNSLKSKGTLAIQMPNNFHSPTHQTTIQVLKKHSAWQDFQQLLRYGELHEPMYKLSWYYDLLTNHGLQQIELWETEYLQEMSDYSGIFAWTKGTALHSLLPAMTNEQQAQFQREYVEAIAKKYPLQRNGKILMPFRRIFMLAVTK